MKRSFSIGFLIAFFCLTLAAFAYGEGSIGVNVVNPQYNFDLSSAGAMKSQMHFSKDGSDTGGWISSLLENNFWLSSGAMYDSALGGWIQKSSDGKSVLAGSGAMGYRIFAQGGTPIGEVIVPIPRLLIDFNGNVGIGTTNPQGRLDVNGEIYQRGTRLHADYVFDPAYKIESIEEHADFMWQNKRLKGVPGAQKDDNGLEVVEVGAHQRGILEELEKAHVYIEQLNEKIKALEAKFKALDQK